MNTIQRLLTISALAMGAALPLAGHAQVSPNSGQTSAPAPASMTDGEVKKVDLDNDKGQLTNLKPGDKVQFMVVQEGGKMIITDIQPVR